MSRSTRFVITDSTLGKMPDPHLQVPLSLVKVAEKTGNTLRVVGKYTMLVGIALDTYRIGMS